MFDVASSEVIVLGVVALLVIPPKDLPKAMRTAGYWIGKVRGVAQQFRSGFDTMVREAELQEMEKKWQEENARIMREHPPEPPQALPHQAAMIGPEGQVDDMSQYDAADYDDGHPALVETPAMKPVAGDGAKAQS